MNPALGVVPPSPNPPHKLNSSGSSRLGINAGFQGVSTNFNGHISMFLMMWEITKKF
jgi:hypothetical protein